MNPRARTAATASFVDVFAMLPVTPTTSGANRRRQPAATAARAARPSTTRMTVTSASGAGYGSSDEDGCRAAIDGVRDVGVTVGPLTGQGHEQTTRHDEPRVDGGVADRSGGPGEEPAAGQADQVVRRQGWLGHDVRRPKRRVGVGHGRQSRIRDTH